MKRAFKTKSFCRWMSKAGLDDDTLREAVANRGGARMIAATNHCGIWLFLFGYQKNERANISKQDEEELQFLGAKLLRMDDILLDAAISAGQIWEITL